MNSGRIYAKVDKPDLIIIRVGIVLLLYDFLEMDSRNMKKIFDVMHISQLQQNDLLYFWV